MVILGLYKNFLNIIPHIIFVIFVVLGFWILDLNHIIYLTAPGASVIRAGGRAFYLLLPFFCYGLAYFLQNFRPKYMTVVLILLFLLEQIPYQYNFRWTKSSHNSRLERYIIPRSCKAVYYDISIEDQFSILDIMWKARQENVYSVNEYSGYQPRIYPKSVPPECRLALP